MSPGSVRARLGSTALTSLLAGLALLAAPSQASAQQRGRKHVGVQVRAVIGPSYLSGWQSLEEAGEDEVSGLASSFNFVLGEMVSESLALNFDLVYARASDAERGVVESTKFTVIHLGVGVTYWMMPANVYLSASLGASSSSVDGATRRFLELEFPDTDTTDVGFGLHLSAGKQFWLGPRWGLGLSLSLLTATSPNPIGRIDTNRNLIGAGAGLSVTFH